MPIEKVEVLNKPFRGFKAFEKYTKEQIASVKELLLMLNKKYGISLKYRPEMWDASREALVGTHGVFTHVSYRSDKSDCYPSQDLIAMLKTLA